MSKAPQTAAEIRAILAAWPETVAAARGEGAAWVAEYFPGLPASVDPGAIWEALQAGVLLAAPSWRPGLGDAERASALDAVGRAIDRLRRVPGLKVTAGLEAALKVARAAADKWKGSARPPGRPTARGRHEAHARLRALDLTKVDIEWLLDTCGLTGATPKPKAARRRVN